MPTVAPRTDISGEDINSALSAVAGMDFLDLLPKTFDLDGKPFNVRQRRPMFAPLFRKAPAAKRMIFMSSRQVGKALDLETPIPTPEGWTTMRDVQVGDWVLDESGRPTMVLSATDPMEDHPCYRIIFDDGEEIVADEEHLWVVSQVGGLPKTVTTVELLDLQPKTKKGTRFSIVAALPLDLPESDLPIHPYLLGVWLGDGDSTQSRISFCKDDHEAIFDRLEAVYPSWGKVQMDKRNGVITRVPMGLSPALRGLGLLGKGMKRIPEVYLRASIEQRIDLVQGIMDTDGSVRRNGGCENTQKNRVLANGLREILSTLGVKSRISRKTVAGKYYWTVGFATSLPVFSLPRKADLQSQTTFGNPKNTRHYVKSIVLIGPRTVKCIGVDSPSRLFLCGRSMIPTHNTASIAGHACMNCAWRPGFKYTYIAPLALYVSRFHHIYMAKMMRSSRLPWNLIDRHCTSAVTEKTFTTGSHFHGVSCFNSAGNALGIPSDAAVFDEVQDLNFDFIPQITEILGTSAFGYEFYFGTARGKENTIQKLFETSSQAEYCIRCSRCGHWNIPTIEEDAISMIQKAGISCSKCCALLDLDSGHWVHAYPDRAKDFVGLHVPQTIVKDRVQPYEKYLDIWNKLYGVRKYSLAKFHNEVMGISVETGSSPITSAQIRSASTLEIGPKKPFRANEYSQFGGGVDWGGNEITSFTVGTIVALHVSGAFHCVNAIRPTGIPENERHLPLAKFFIDNCPRENLFAIMADGAFVGSVQNPNMARDSGIEVGSIHYGSMKKFFSAHPGNHFTIDRTTLLFVVFSLIKSGLLLFPNHDLFTSFTDDLKSVFIEEVDTQRGTFLKYCRYVGLPDDFLHSLGYALFSCALGAGVDLPSLVGLSAQSSVTRDYIDAIGEEMAVSPG